MVAAALRLVGFDLQRQLARLRIQAEDFKDRTTDEIKNKAVNAGVAIALAFTGLVFVVLTVVVGLIALYLWVEMEQGRFAALGAVALATAALAAVMFIVAVSRAKSETPKKVKSAAERLEATAAAYSSAAVGEATAPPLGVSASSLIDDLTRDLTSQASAVANEAIDSAADVIRKSPREALFAAMAIAMITGVVAGRRR